MAKHTVTHACGHEQEHQLYGPHKERDRKLAWLEGTPCTACFHAQRDQQRAATSAAAAEQNQRAGLVPLQGSEKQVAWAESIRAPIVALLAEFEAALAFDPALSDAAREELGDACVLVIDEIRGQESAKWWIDVGRDLDFRKVADVTVHVFDRIESRHLAPTAEKETAEIRARREAEEEERRRAEQIAVAEVVAALTVDALSYDPATATVSGRVAGREVRHDGRGSASITIDGVKVLEPAELRWLLDRFAHEQQTALRAEERKRLCDSLAGAVVASVAKAKQKVEVTLVDGRVLTGGSDRSGWFIDGQKGVRLPGLMIDHPEVVRLAREARAWAKQNGVK